jgi:DNA adenine methylase
MSFQESLFEVGLPASHPTRSAPRGQLLKWIGNKQRMAREIAQHLPEQFGSYYEPFLGGGAVLATMAPKAGRASDTFGPLMEIWLALSRHPETLKGWYAERWHQAVPRGDKVEQYERIKASYNSKPNGADLVFLCRACYGGVVRFRKADGYMSTPCGAHRPISPASFGARVDLWRERISGTQFSVMEYEEAMKRARKGDVVYCDPPYTDSQAILYGAQDFSIEHLLEVIADCKRRGVFVALSIDGTKRSGDKICDVPIPKGLFKYERFVRVGRSMLRRFQMGGKSLEGEVVSDRLLLTG